MHGSPSDILNIKKKVEKALTPLRFRHVQAVAKLAQAMAGVYRVSPHQAYLAGLLHDCARDLKRPALQKILKHYSGRFAPTATRENVCLWHNPVGVYLARTTYEIKDTMILRAIGIHSTGQVKMRNLDKLIYVADFCEPHRKHKAAIQVRKLLENNLNAATKRVTEEKINYLLNHKRSIHPWTLALAREQGITIKT